MQMIDVIKKLQEIQGRSPEELGRAIGTVAKLNTIAPTEQKVVEAKSTAMPDTSNGSYMVDVLNKLRELESRSPEMAHAIANASKMGIPAVAPVAEGIEIKTSGDDAILAQILKLAGMVDTWSRCVFAFFPSLINSLARIGLASCFYRKAPVLCSITLNAAIYCFKE